MAIVWKDGERLYLTNWEYNMARVISELARLIQDRGGRCKRLPYAMVTNRTSYNKAVELKSKVELYEQNINKYSNAELIEKLKTALEKTRAEYEQAKAAADNEKPVKVEYTSYIDFVLNDTRYYFQIDNNPFFPVLASKTPVKNGKYSRDAVLGECNTEWAIDELILRSATDTTVKTTAARILEHLTGEKNSPIYRDGKKQRVSNIYDGGYHYEMIYRPERVATLDY